MGSVGELQPSWRAAAGGQVLYHDVSSGNISMFKQLNCSSISCLHPLWIPFPLPHPRNSAHNGSKGNPPICHLKKASLQIWYHVILGSITKSKSSTISIWQKATLLLKNCLRSPHSDCLLSPCNTTFHAMPSLLPVKRFTQLHCERD